MTTLRITPTSIVTPEIVTPENPPGHNQSTSTALGIPTSQPEVLIAGSIDWPNFWKQDTKKVDVERYESAIGRAFQKDIQNAISNGRNNPDDLLKGLQSLNQLPASQIRKIVTTSEFATLKSLVETAALVASDMPDDKNKMNVNQRNANIEYASNLGEQLDILRYNLISRQYPDSSPRGFTTNILQEAYSRKVPGLDSFIKTLDALNGDVYRVTKELPKSPTGVYE